MVLKTKRFSLSQHPHTCTFFKCSWSGFSSFPDTAYVAPLRSRLLSAALFMPEFTACATLSRSCGVRDILMKIQLNTDLVHCSTQQEGEAHQLVKSLLKATSTVKLLATSIIYHPPNLAGEMNCMKWSYKPSSKFSYTKPCDSVVHPGRCPLTTYTN